MSVTRPKVELCPTPVAPRYIPITVLQPFFLTPPPIVPNRADRTEEDIVSAISAHTVQVLHVYRSPLGKPQLLRSPDNAAVVAVASGHITVAANIRASCAGRYLPLARHLFRSQSSV